MSLFNPDGTTDDGIEFFTITQLAQKDPNGFFVEELIEDAELRFYNPKGVTFTFEVVILGALNEPPVFTNEPTFNNVATRTVDIVAGETFAFDFDAADPEGDAPLTFCLPSAPTGFGFANPVTGPTTGIVSWTPAPSTVGSSYPVTMRVMTHLGRTMNLALIFGR